MFSLLKLQEGRVSAEGADGGWIRANKGRCDCSASKVLTAVMFTPQDFSTHSIIAACVRFYFGFAVVVFFHAYFRMWSVSDSRTRCQKDTQEESKQQHKLSHLFLYQTHYNQERFQPEQTYSWLYCHVCKNDEKWVSLALTVMSSYFKRSRVVEEWGVVSDKCDLESGSEEQRGGGGLEQLHTDSRQERLRFKSNDVIGWHKYEVVFVNTSFFLIFGLNVDYLLFIKSILDPNNPKNKKLRAVRVFMSSTLINWQLCCMNSGLLRCTLGNRMKPGTKPPISLLADPARSCNHKSTALSSGESRPGLRQDVAALIDV